MKLKDGFLLREIAGKQVVIPVSGDLDLNLMITLNSTGVILWKALEQGAELSELVALLTEKFDVDAETAELHVKKFLEKLIANDFLES